MKEIKNYITPFGLNRLLRERDLLLKTERPKICEVIAWAAGNGDRSENADYIYGKKRLREIDSRLRFLNSRLDAAEVVDPEAIDSERVQFGATVKVELDDGEQKIFCIVGADEIDVDRGFISWKSPIGKALLHKEEGDDFVIHAPKGEIEATILSISYKKINFEGE